MNKQKLAISILLSAILLLSAVAFSACNKDDDTPAQQRNFVKTDGIRLLDGFGEPFGLQGTNFGGWLVQESYLCPTDVGGEYGQIDMMLTLANRFDNGGTLDKMNGLLNAYEDNWITEADFANVKALGMNCVRIPFTYLNLTNAVCYDPITSKYVRTPFEELTLLPGAFARLDWAVGMCKKYELYAILDMHGAVGSQTGNDHTGDITNKSVGGLLFLDDETGETCRAKTKYIWEAIAERYRDNVWIAAYDILNEPGGANNETGKAQWDYFDVLYDAIRAKDANHVIMMESCWEAGDLPALSEYGWENVIYQYHHYNWASMNLSNAAYYQLKALSIDSKERNYPVLIGEFSVWPDTHPDKRTSVGNRKQTEAEAWDGVMDFYTDKGWSYTSWNYKHAAYSSSWGLYNLKTDAAAEQANYLTDSYERIFEIWSSHSSALYAENISLTSVFKKYMPKFYTGAEVKSYDDPFYILGSTEEENN